MQKLLLIAKVNLISVLEENDTPYMIVINLESHSDFGHSAGITIRKLKVLNDDKSLWKKIEI